MRSILRWSFIVILLLAGLGLLALTNAGVLSFDKPYIHRLSAELPAADPLVAIVDVNVIPMDSERVEENQTVIVRDGMIETIGNAAQVQAPDGAQVVDGTGKYLMPGLVDMHVHVEYENDLLLLVANGVTSIRNLWGNTGKKLRVGMPDQLELRRQIEQGRLLGPTIYTAGPVMEGEPAFHPLAETVVSPQEAAQSVSWQKAQGYDVIKVYDHLSPEVYQAIVDTARENDMPVVGHVPFAVGLDGVLASGQQTIEHLTGYVDPDAVEFIIPRDQLDDYAVKTREAGVWNCVTLSEYPKTKETAEGVQRLENQPGMLYVSPGTRLLTPFLYYMMGKSHTYAGADYPQRIAALNREMVQALHRAGAGILLGTDAAQAYHIPGFSVHEELALLVEAGLSPYEALAAGTRSAAEAMGKLDEFGTIAPGHRADLLLLTANPLEDVSAAQQRAGVMVRGRWFAESELQAMLGGLVASYEPGWFQRVWPAGIVAVAVVLAARRLRRRGSRR
ncbi:MAG: amidohydrolase family protein [Anaerolineae bacterium]